MDRREFLVRTGSAVLGASLAGRPARSGLGEDRPVPASVTSSREQVASEPVTLLLAGDVMPGRGIDQVLPRSVDPTLHEDFVKSAATYVEIAEAANGPIPDEVPFDYVWGDALAAIERVGPAARVINLETAVTTSSERERWKGIHYRMHPGNVPVLTAAGIDACVLANNHVLDWGVAGLRETLQVLQAAGIATPGAGLDAGEASEPAELRTAAGRLLVFAYGTPEAGVPPSWAAAEDSPGVRVLAALGSEQADAVIEEIEARRRPGDRVVVSLHWGGNWGYEVPRSQREFAHRLVDAGVADVVHGHSSHHPKAIERYRGRLILYGCGDLLNDYEGISGHEEYRSDLSLLYFPVLDPRGVLAGLEMAPMRIRRFRLQRASDEEARWLAARLDRECRPLGSRVELEDGRPMLRWD